jgi:GNAT superfamily N-acetyltransferase
MVAITFATIDDVPAIAQLLLDAFEEFRPLYTAGGFAATTPDAGILRRRFAEGPIWIARDGAAIAGTVAATKRRDALYLRSMAVAPTARGRGIARALLTEVGRFAIERGFAALTLTTTPFLHPAIALYDRSGFVSVGEEDLFGTPLIAMSKPLV